MKAWVILPLLIGSFACKKAEDPISPNPEVVLKAPWNIGNVVPTVERNPFTREGIELGRILFFDPVLSSSNQISCASCHFQSIAFSDGTALTNVGESGNTLVRHTPALINLAWMDGLFWDGGAKDIESLAFGPITNPDEMGQSLLELEAELNLIPAYKRKFHAAFGVNEISRTEIARALAQFQRTLISANSPYDQWVRGENGTTLTSEELEGLGIFKSKCSSCHSTDLFTDNSYHNNGIDDDFSNYSMEYVFFGRYRISYDSADIGAFKTPTLRNSMVTAPYMHDGRFQSIDQVLDHYSSGIKYSQSLDPILKQNGFPLKMDFTETERIQLKAFLNTLTDTEFLTNSSLSNPFAE